MMKVVGVFACALSAVYAHEACPSSDPTCSAAEEAALLQHAVSRHVQNEGSCNVVPAATCGNTQINCFKDLKCGVAGENHTCCNAGGAGNLCRYCGNEGCPPCPTLETPVTLPADVKDSDNGDKTCADCKLHGPNATPCLIRAAKNVHYCTGTVGGKDCDHNAVDCRTQVKQIMNGEEIILCVKYQGPNRAIGLATHGTGYIDVRHFDGTTAFTWKVDTKHYKGVQSGGDMRLRLIRGIEDDLGGWSYCYRNAWFAVDSGNDKDYGTVRIVRNVTAGTPVKYGDDINIHIQQQGGPWHAAYDLSNHSVKCEYKNTPLVFVPKKAHENCADVH